MRWQDRGATRQRVARRPSSCVAGLYGGVRVRIDGEPVVDLADAGGVASGPLGIAHLGVRAYRAAQDRLIAVHLDGDVVRVERGAPLQRFLDPLFHVRRRGPHPHRDQVRHPLDAGEVTDRALRGFLLVVPVHVTLERQPPLLDLHLDAVLRDGDVPLERVQGRVRDVGIGPRRARGELHFDVVRDGLHPFDLAGHAFGGPLLGVAVHEARQRDYAVTDAHRDVVIPEARRPPQLGDDVLLDIDIGAHKSSFRNGFARLSNRYARAGGGRFVELTNAFGQRGRRSVGLSGPEHGRGGAAFPLPDRLRRITL